MKKLLLGGLLLTVSQWYAFFLISQISLFIFPVVFGVIIFILGFIGRGMGSIIFGYVGDKVSRKTVLYLTALILVISSILMIVVYNYYTVVVFRFLQGLSLGGEWGGASTIIVEAYSTSKFRGFMASIIQLAVPISVILSSFSIFLLSVFSYLGGWRFSLIIAIIISLISFYLIKDATDIKVEGKSKLPLLDALKNDWRNILKAIGIKISESANFYIFTSYVFAKSTLTNIISVIVIVSISLQLLLMPIFGYLSDIIGRRMVILAGTILMIVGAFLFPLNLILGELTLSVSDAALYAPQSSLFTELFDKKYRITAANFSYQLASIIGGSIAPTILRITNYQVLIVVLPYAIITLVCLALVSETKGKRIT